MQLRRTWIVYGILSTVIILAGAGSGFRNDPAPRPKEAIMVLDPAHPAITDGTPITDEEAIILAIPGGGPVKVSSAYSRIEKKEAEGWRAIPYRPNTHGTIKLAREEWITERINITGLDSGQYRVGRSTGGGASTFAWIEFRVERPEEDLGSRPAFGFRPIYFYENWQKGLQTLELANLGARTILVASGYRLERLTVTGWVTEASVGDAGPPVKVGSWGIYRQRFQLPVGDGEYRYVKEIRCEGSDWVEKLVFPYEEWPYGDRAYIWDPEPNLRSREFSERVNPGPYVPGDSAPIRVQHLGGNEDGPQIQLRFELLRAKDLSPVSTVSSGWLDTYKVEELTLGVPADTEPGTYYVRLTASYRQGPFSSITRVVQVNAPENTPLAPGISIQADPPNSRIFWLTVENRSPRDIILIDRYTLERFGEGEWRGSTIRDSRVGDEVPIRSGGFWWRRIDFTGLEEGKYRLALSMRYRFGEYQVFTVEFCVG